MNGLQEILQRNVDLIEESAQQGDGTPIARISKALMKRSLAIIGPCAAQTPDQMDELIDEIERTEPDATIVIRCCHDKPRSLDLMADGTRTWNGIGLTEGLRILQRMKKRRPDLQLIAEIRHAQQLDDLAPLLDAVWIGNREGRATIQDVTAAAAVHHLPVFIKNSSVPGELGVEDMKGRVIAGLAAAAEDKNGKAHKLHTIVVPLLRGTPADPSDGIFRNIPNIGWIRPLQAWSPGLPVVMDAGHILRPDLREPNGDPKVLEVVEGIIFQALAHGASGFMAEITGSVPSKTDPGVPARAFLEWLADSPLPNGVRLPTL